MEEDDEDEDEFLAAWEPAEAAAVDVLRQALPELRDALAPARGDRWTMIVA